MSEYGKRVAKKTKDYMGNPNSVGKEINDIQNAIEGVEVRGALAAGVAKSFNKSKWAEEKAIEQTERVDTLIKENPQPSEVVDARGNYPILRDRLDSVDSQLAQIDNKHIEINVKSPPKETGLQGLTMTDPEEDRIRLQAIFDYIFSNQVHYQPQDRQSTGYTYTLYFPNGIYEWSTSVIMKGSYLRIKGNRAIVRVTDNSYAFTSGGDNGWKLEFEGFTFDRCNAVKQINDNIEAGKTDFVNCWFYHSPNEAIYIDKPSSMIFLDKCHFYRCAKIMYVEKADAVYLERSWINSAPRSEQYPEDIEVTTRLFVDKTFFIPTGAIEPYSKDIAWIKNHNFTRITRSRFSSELGSKTMVNNYATASTVAGGVPTGVELENNDYLAAQHGEVFVRLFNMPNKLKVADNITARLADKLIGFADSFDYSTIKGSSHLYSVYVGDNVGRTTNAWDIPEELKKYQRVNDKGLKDKSDILSPKSGSASNGKFTILTTHTRGSRTIRNNMYLVRITANSHLTFFSSYLGVISFRETSALGGLAYEVKIEPLTAFQGGSTTGTVINTPVEVSVRFTNTGTTEVAWASGSSEQLEIEVSWDSETTGEISYEVRNLFSAVTQ